VVGCGENVNSVRFGDIAEMQPISCLLLPEKSALSELGYRAVLSPFLELQA